MRIRRVALALAAPALLAGCGSVPVVAGPVAVQAPASAAPVSAAPASAGPGPAAPVKAVATTLNFTGTTLDGAKFDASSLSGKPAILWFWAPWCATCASEAQSIADLKDKYGDALSILGIAGMGDNKAMHQFVSDLSVGNVPHLDDQAGKVWKRFKITEQSTYVFVNRDGKVVRTGYLDDLQLTAEVKSLVA